MTAPIFSGRARRKSAWRASPAPSRKLEAQVRILRDAFQPTYDQYAVGGHHGVARARFGAAATRRKDPNHSDQTCFKACRLLLCKRAGLTSDWLPQKSSTAERHAWIAVSRSCEG